MSFRNAGTVACACIMAFAACTYRPGEPDGGKPSGEDPARRGGTLMYSVSDDAGLLDPQLAAQPGAFALIRATQRGLTGFPRIAATGGTGGTGGAAPPPADPVPDLAAAAPVVSADGLEYTFRLRDGIAFGAPALRPVVAADVKAGIERAIRLPSPLRPYLGVVEGAAEFRAGNASGVSGIRAVDATTVAIRLARPANDLMWILAHPSASAVPAGTADALAPEAIAPSGPYRIDHVVPGREIRLVRNPTWRASADPIRRAYVDRIVVRVGTADGADLTGDDVAPSPSAPVHAVDAGCLVYLFVSPSGPFADPSARAVVSQAIDRTALLREGAKSAPSLGRMRPATTLLPSVIAGAPDPTAPPGNATGPPRRLPRPVRVALGRETSGPDAAEDRALSAGLSAMLAAAGIEATPLTVRAPGSIYQRYEAGTAPMGIARWCPDWPGRGVRAVVGALAGSGGAANYGRTSDATLDRLIAVAVAERVPAKIPAATKAAADRALAPATVIPLAFFSDQVQVSARVRDFAPDPLFVRGDPANVWLAPSDRNLGEDAPPIAVRYTFPVPASNGGVCC